MEVTVTHNEKVNKQRLAMLVRSLAIFHILTGIMRGLWTSVGQYLFIPGTRYNYCVNS